MSIRIKYGILFALSAVLLSISAIYSPVWYDDAGHYIVVREAASQGHPCYPVNMALGACDPDSPYITMGPALTWPLVIGLRFLGFSMENARAWMVFFSLLSLAAFGLLAMALLGKHEKVLWAMGILMGGIQWVTYGSEVLAEVPMLAWVCLGLWAQLRFLEKGGWYWAVISMAAWLLAVLTKEYVLVVIGMAMIFWCLQNAYAGRWAQFLRVAFQGLALLLAWFMFHTLEAGNFGGALDWLQVRSSYGSEFLALEFWESLRFLAFKPHILLGTLALVVKVIVKRTPRDILLLCFQSAWIVFFLLSAGYDRFGFQLSLIPAIYLAEFVLLAWNRWGSRKLLRSIGFALGFILLFWQGTLIALPRRILDTEGRNFWEREVASQLAGLGIRKVFTYDQQIIPFLPADLLFRLCRVVPSNAEACSQLWLAPDEVLVAGIYAQTEFKHCFDKQNLHLLAEIKSTHVIYSIYGPAPITVPASVPL